MAGFFVNTNDHFVKIKKDDYLQAEYKVKSMITRIWGCYIKNNCIYILIKLNLEQLPTHKFLLAQQKKDGPVDVILQRLFRFKATQVSDNF